MTYTSKLKMHQIIFSVLTRDAPDIRPDNPAFLYPVSGQIQDCPAGYPVTPDTGYPVTPDTGYPANVKLIQ
jgi:hypothetical protein